LHEHAVYINNEMERITLKRKWMQRRFNSCVLILCAVCGTACSNEIMFKVFKPEVNPNCIGIKIQFQTCRKHCVSILNISSVHGDKK
jgi:NAD-dependent dihydropyrimidine dehydrogenase PreA subunit